MCKNCSVEKDSLKERAFSIVILIFLFVISLYNASCFFSVKTGGLP